MDRITLKGMVFYAHHGHTENERNLGGKFEVDCDIWKDLKPAGSTDALRHSADVREIYKFISAIVLGEKFHTIEALAEKISEKLLRSYALDKVVVRVRKPNPPSVGITDYLEVEIERKA